jgi:NADPH:quinone reductase-like Zn-dependent oxidoreductase
VTSLGAVHVVDYTEEDFTNRGEVHDVILDAVGKKKSSKALAQCERALAPNGKSVSVDDRSPKLLREDLTLLKQLSEAGELKPVIDRSYPLEQIVEAHRYVENGHKRGNVVIAVGHVTDVLRVVPPLFEPTS